jgi:hypothetical protein
MSLQLASFEQVCGMHVQQCIYTLFAHFSFARFFSGRRIDGSGWQISSAELTMHWMDNESFTMSVTTIQLAPDRRSV